MKDAKSLYPKAGQTALLYDNGNVILKKDYTKESVIYTRFEYFIGSKEEVDAKILELGLKETPEPKFELPKQPKKEETK